ncbi:MAG: glycosyl hydrolase family 31 [Chamaesiphon sp.]|nr:glycosyl hydrolase family 31 [Chamaesiphon sp.]
MSTQLLAIVKNGRIEPIEPIDLPEGTQLIVTLNSSVETRQESEESEWYTLSLNGLNRAYSDDEPDYELSQIKEFNSNYERR